MSGQVQKEKMNLRQEVQVGEGKNAGRGDVSHFAGKKVFFLRSKGAAGPGIFG